MSRYLSCGRKKKYTHALAARIATRQRRATNEVVTEYFCHECGWWHVGSNAESRIRKSSRKMWKPGRKRALR